ncbi:MAG: signal peptidase II [Lachnospiraceae bacterium]|nr:signal peptidase II [Lachnospiraceae bacterium]
MLKTKRLITDIIIMALLVALDQVSKLWAVRNLKDGTPIILIKGVLQLYYLPNGNTGAAFGILSGHRILFLCIALLVVAVIFYALLRIPCTSKYTFLRILLVFIAAGGAGNMIDRFRLGYVIDFIYFYLINFPIFNVADCYVSVSTILVALIILFGYKENELKELEAAFKLKKGNLDE